MIDGLENPKCGSKRAELTAPCKGCKDRKPCCHDSCERYESFKANIAKKNKYMRDSVWDASRRKFYG